MNSQTSSENIQPNIKDVAKIVGCSPASVTRALSGYPHMRESLREKIIAVANEIGYRPDLLASSLRKGSSKTIGVLVSDILNPSITRIFDTIETELRDAGYGVIFTNSNGNSEYDLENLLILKQRRVDALIASFSNDSGQDLLQQLKIMKIPVVLLDRSINLPNLSEVLTDHKSGAIKLTNHLFDQGHKRIALINGPISGYPSRERHIGYKLAHKEREIQLDPELHRSGRGSEAFGRSAVEELLDLKKSPTSLIIGNGNTSTISGVLGVLQDRGITVGQDLAVAIAEDTPLYPLFTPPFTALSRDLNELAQWVVKIVLEELESGPKRSQKILLPTQLIVRASTSKAKK